MITDAGTPGISDPAYKLIRGAIDASVSVSPVPGPSAVIAALVSSGLPTDRFIFEGFLPPKKGRRKRILSMIDENATVVLYESPKRLVRTLNDLLNEMGDRPAVIGREITKIHEEMHRGTISDLISYFSSHPAKGECVIMIGKNNPNVYFS